MNEWGGEEYEEEDSHVDCDNACQRGVFGARFVGKAIAPLNAQESMDLFSNRHGHGMNR